MEIPLQLKEVELGDLKINLFVPDEQAIQESYIQKLRASVDVEFPYWAKIWPSAIAISRALVKHPEIYSGKAVLELAAGLGLPSLVVAKLAGKVICSDNQQEAVATIKKSVIHNRYKNLDVQLLDLDSIPENLTCDLLLLSDINYEPATFKILEKLVNRYLNKGTTILLSTPQRLMAKPFIATLVDHISDQEEYVEAGNNETAIISVLTLKK